MAAPLELAAFITLMVKITIFWTFLLRLDLSSTQKLSKRALLCSCLRVLRFCKWSNMWSKNQPLVLAKLRYKGLNSFNRATLKSGCDKQRKNSSNIYKPSFRVHTMTLVVFVLLRRNEFYGNQKMICSKQRKRRRRNPPLVRRIFAKTYIYLRKNLK